MNHTSLSRRLLAGAASLAIGVAGALALGSPAAAEGTDKYTAEPMNPRGVSVAGSAECDEDAQTWTVEWTVTNTTAAEIATIVGPAGTQDGEPVNPDVDGFNHNDVFQPLESKTGTQTLPSGTESATFAATLRWSDPVGNEEFLTDSDTVELGDCPSEPKEPPADPPADPAIIVFSTCDLLVFIIDNSEGGGEVAVTFTPDQTVTHGHASGFSYTIDEENNVEITAEEGAGIHQVVGEADGSNPVELGPFAAGADPHTHAFEAFEGLTVTVGLTLDGEPVELEDPAATWSAEGLDCPEEPEEPGDDDGQGGELPKTGSATTLIAGGAVALLVLGGGLYLVARRRRVTFTA